MPERALVIGGGGREHALGCKLKQSPFVSEVFFAPGNAGTSRVGTNVNIEATDVESLKRCAVEKKMGLTVVGPEDSLEKGVVNAFQEGGLPIFGPTQEAARLETRKAWAIRFMQRHGIPHPRSEIFDNVDDALYFLKHTPWKASVIKANGLAAGKGVFLPDSSKEAERVVRRILVNKEFDDGEKVIIQERLVGREVSLLALSDGETFVPLPPAQDHIGDPETQPLMMLLSSDLFRVLKSCVDGNLANTPVEFRKGSALCTVLASGGYPGDFETD